MIPFKIETTKPVSPEFLRVIETEFGRAMLKSQHRRQLMKDWVSKSQAKELKRILYGF